MTAKEKMMCVGKTQKKVTNIKRGQEMAIHQSFFRTWMDCLEENIKSFTNVDPSITKLEDFTWFCKEPKFNGPAKSTFCSQVDSHLRITNNSTLNSVAGRDKHSPRLAIVKAI